MKLNKLFLAFILIGPVHSLAVGPAGLSNPYWEPITRRNVFSLRHAPAQTPQPQLVLPAVRLCGIATVPGGRRAVLRVSRPALASERTKETSLILGEGTLGKEGVQVLNIDVAAATVKILNRGTLQTLTLR